MAGDMIWKRPGRSKRALGCDGGGTCRKPRGPRDQVAEASGSDRWRPRLELLSSSSQCDAMRWWRGVAGRKRCGSTAGGCGRTNRANRKLLVDRC